VRKLPTRKLLGALIAGALFLPNEGFTLGLGEIEVNSALNQKLNADIEILSATPEDTETLIVKLASRKEFQRAGLDRPYELNDLRFKSVVIDGAPHIIVTSSSPIREPFLNFLLEVDWPKGHLLREYTVLLDPPVFMTQSASSAAAPVTQASATADNTGFRPSSSGTGNVVPVFAPGVSASSVSPRPAAQSPSDSMAQAPVNPAFIPAPMVQQQTSINQPPGSYRIQSGDTAWSLADAMRPDRSITVEQMMIAMLRANPESCLGVNI
jgi:pilus assembly protein FimV